MATCGEYVATRTAAAAVIDEWGIHSPSAKQKQEAEREREQAVYSKVRGLPNNICCILKIARKQSKNKNTRSYTHPHVECQQQ